jgi:hypothetical protein
MSKKIAKIIIPFLLAITIAYIQYSYNLIGAVSSKINIFSSGSILITAIISGFLFGLVGCPGCALPAVFSLMPWRNNLCKAATFLVLFNLMRIASMFTYALAGNFSIGFIKNLFTFYQLPINLLFSASGVIIIVFAFFILYNFTPQLQLNSGKTASIVLLYLIWGISLGAVCGFEATGFLTYLWLWPAQLAQKILILAMFALFAVMPSLIIGLICLLGARKIIEKYSRIQVYMRNLSFFYLLVVGLLIIVYFFPKAL